MEFVLDLMMLTIITHLEHNNVLSELQHGFRKKRSTDSQLILAVQDLAADLDKGQQIYAVLLDLLWPVSSQMEFVLDLMMLGI
jgi:hypothetical protein